MVTKTYKVQSIGGNIQNGKQAQLYIAVPMQWANRHSLKKGDTLVIHFDEDGGDRLIVHPSG